MKKVVLSLIALALIVIVPIAILLFSNKYPLSYKKDIVFAAEKYDIEPALVSAIIFSESGFNKNAKSAKGACGLMQIMPQTAAWISGEIGNENYNLFDAKINIEFGCFYVNYLKQKFDSEIELLCAYNAGETKARGWKEEFGGITQENIPYSETRNYVKKVLNAKKYYIKKFK